MLEVTVETVAIDPMSNSPVVILREPRSNRILPIWIGPAEAAAIRLELMGEKPPRPLTHDLLSNMLGELGVKVVRVVIHDLVDRTYYAAITLERNHSTCEIDSRPSDALALALRAKAPVFIAGNVVGSLVELHSDSAEEIERFQRLIKDLDEEIKEE